MDFINDTLIQRFWSKVKIGALNECWEWQAKSVHRNGYGYIGGIGKRKIYSHRVACYIAHGDAPEGKPLALHSCANSRCNNPSHLRWGTHKQNMLDSRKDGNNRQQKLTETQVAYIKRLIIAGFKNSYLSKCYGVSWSAIDDIRHQRRWIGVQPYNIRALSPETVCGGE